MKSSRQGITLIELLVATFVLGLIGVFVAMALQNEGLRVRRIKIRSQAARSASDLVSILSAETVLELLELFPLPIWTPVGFDGSVGDRQIPLLETEPIPGMQRWVRFQLLNPGSRLASLEVKVRRRARGLGVLEERRAQKFHGSQVFRSPHHGGSQDLVQRTHDGFQDKVKEEDWTGAKDWFAHFGKGSYEAWAKAQLENPRQGARLLQRWKERSRGQSVSPPDPPSGSGARAPRTRPKDSGSASSGPAPRIEKREPPSDSIPNLERIPEALLLALESRYQVSRQELLRPQLPEGRFSDQVSVLLHPDEDQVGVLLHEIEFEGEPFPLLEIHQDPMSPTGLRFAGNDVLEERFAESDRGPTRVLRLAGTFVFASSQGPDPKLELRASKGFDPAERASRKTEAELEAWLARRGETWTKAGKRPSFEAWVSTLFGP